MGNDSTPAAAAAVNGNGNPLGSEADLMDLLDAAGAIVPDEVTGRTGHPAPGYVDASGTDLVARILAWRADAAKAPRIPAQGTRAVFVQALREFADLVESTPAIPLPALPHMASVDVWSHLHHDEGTQDGRFTAVHDFADAFGAEVAEDREGDRKARTGFGPITLHVFGYADPARPASRAVTRPAAVEGALGVAA
jgi:hypothetical protein